MNADAIIERLATADGLPRATLRAASADRAELAPRFVQEIEDYLARDAAEPDQARHLFFIIHLLGEWREMSAYRPLAQLLRLPSRQAEAILGDGMIGTAHRVLAAVFDGDPQPICDIILDTNADEHVRSRMCELLAMLVLRGQLDRERVAKFLRDCFTNLRPQATCYVWVGWQMAIGRLGLTEFQSLVETVFNRQYVDPFWCGHKHFLRELAEAADPQQQARWLSDRDYTPFGNTVDELSTWHSFNEERQPDRQRVTALKARTGAAALSAPKSKTAVGRNEPCPCGSGKKFKKCCLN